MYLVSLYFDEESNKCLKKYINLLCEKTGNTFMQDKNVPPHLTIAAFETKNEEAAREALGICFKELSAGEIMWVSIGAFLPSVLYATPVVNEYLHGLSVKINEALSEVEGVKLSPYYRPFQWFPHTTLGKTLTPEEMSVGFNALQTQFVPLKGKVKKIGLAKANPYRDLIEMELS